MPGLPGRTTARPGPTSARRSPGRLDALRAAAQVPPVLPLASLDVLVVDCQTTGATPAHGVVLEIGWAIARAAPPGGGPPEVRQLESHWITLPPGHRVPAPVRRLTGFDPAQVSETLGASDAWQRLRSALSAGPAPADPAASGPAPAGSASAGSAASGPAPAGSASAGSASAGSASAGSASAGSASAGSVPTAIHFAQFELGFLRDWALQYEPTAPFPLDVVCVHAIACRLFPDLPRRSIRAL